jgi:hypothetical protein
LHRHRAGGVGVCRRVPQPCGQPKLRRESHACFAIDLNI